MKAGVINQTLDDALLAKDAGNTEDAVNTIKRFNRLSSGDIGIQNEAVSGVQLPLKRVPMTALAPRVNLSENILPIQRKINNLSDDIDNEPSITDENADISDIGNGSRGSVIGERFRPFEQSNVSLITVFFIVGFFLIVWLCFSFYKDRCNGRNNNVAYIIPIDDSVGNGKIDMF